MQQQSAIAGPRLCSVVGWSTLTKPHYRLAIVNQSRYLSFSSHFCLSSTFVPLFFTITKEHTTLFTIRWSQDATDVGEPLLQNLFLTLDAVVAPLSNRAAMPWPRAANLNHL